MIPTSANMTPFDMAQEFAERFGSRVVALGEGGHVHLPHPLDGFSLDWVGLGRRNHDDDLREARTSINAPSPTTPTTTAFSTPWGFADLESRTVRMASPAPSQRTRPASSRLNGMLAQLQGFHFDDATEAAPADRGGCSWTWFPSASTPNWSASSKPREPAPAVRRRRSRACCSRWPGTAGPGGTLGQNAYHHADVLEHSLRALDACDGEPAWLPGWAWRLCPNAPRPELLRLSCLLDLARPTPEPWTIKTASISTAIPSRARAILKRLKYSNAVTEAVADLCLNHLRPLAQIKRIRGTRPSGA